MNKILKKMWNGEFNPSVHIGGNNPALTGQMQDLDTLRKIFEKTLSPEQIHIFDDFLCEQALLENELLSDAFTCGFKLGVKMLTFGLTDGEGKEV